MKTVVILGAGQFGRAVSRLINTEELRLVGFGDNNTGLHHMSETEKIGMGFPAHVPVLPVAQAVSIRPDYILTGVTDGSRTGQLMDQARSLGFQGDFICLGELYRHFDIRSATLRQIAVRLHEQGIPGQIAELGVYRGDMAWKLNALFPDRFLYLFDTFEGFDPRDIEKEEAYGCSRAKKGDFSDTSKQAVLNRLPFPDRAVVREGYFPGTASGLESETYALVSLDADLYAPLLAGLEYFYPRLSPGAMILMHDYNNERFRGARQAVADYEKRHHRLILVPLCDLHGSAVIVRP